MKKNTFLAVVFVSICLALSCKASAENKPLPQKPAAVTGRLFLEVHGQENWLILHGMDGLAYLIAGNLKDSVKAAFDELGPNNLIAITGSASTIPAAISCNKSTNYTTNAQGEKELNSDISCVRYYNFDVNEIVSKKTSEEQVPSPQRDLEQEQKLKDQLSREGTAPKIRGEIYGTIKSVRLNSPIKTVEIENRDKESPIQSLVLFIWPDTKIIKPEGNKEKIITVPLEQLKVGRRVVATYSREESKTSALVISITGE